MSEHQYEIRRDDGGLGAPRLWCATTSCKGYRDQVADSGGSSFPGVWLFEQMAAHALRYGHDPEPVGVVQVDGDHTHAELETLRAELTALRAELTALRAAPLPQIDVKANWEIKAPEQPRTLPGAYVMLGGLMALIGMVASRLLGWL